MEVVINNNIYKQASDYAQQQGLSLSTVIENFLIRFIGHSKATTNQTVPDIVLSLLGAGEPVADDDMNAREAKADAIITRNGKDFSNSKLPVMTAGEFLATLDH